MEISLCALFFVPVIKTDKKEKNVRKRYISNVLSVFYYSFLMYDDGNSIFCSVSEESGRKF